MVVEQSPGNKKESSQTPSARHFLASLLRKYPEKDPRILCISCQQENNDNRFFVIDLDVRSVSRPVLKTSD